MSFAFAKHPSRTFTAVRLAPEGGTGRTTADRQAALPGWDQDRVAGLTVVQVGAGGSGSQLAAYLGRVGVGTVHLVDPDPLAVSNLNRVLARPDDLYCPKGLIVARRAAEQSCQGTSFVGHPLYFSEFRAHFPGLVPDLIVECVDNNEARRDIERWALAVGRPSIHMGVSDDAGAGYVFVQEPGHACLGCVLGDVLFSGRTQPCSGVPVAMDVLQVVGGLAGYALSTFFSARRRHWNIVRVFLATGAFQAARVARDQHCRLCGGRG